MADDLLYRVCAIVAGPGPRCNNRYRSLSVTAGSKLGHCRETFSLRREDPGLT